MTRIKRAPKPSRAARPPQPGRIRVLLTRTGALAAPAPELAGLLEAHGIAVDVGGLFQGRRGDGLRSALEAAGGEFEVWVSGRPSRVLTFRLAKSSRHIVATLERLELTGQLQGRGLYEVTTSERDFGRLQALYIQSARLPMVGVTCYSFFAGLDEPCEGCPVRLLRGAREVSSVLSGAGLPQWIARAERLDKTTARVASVALSDAHVSRLFALRVGRASVDAGLSPRERSVLEYLLLGRSLGQIGEELSITTRTVRFHLGNVLKKFGADSRADLVRLLL